MSVYTKQWVKTQLQRYSVALVSFFVALTSLDYNTWRNEQTEANRNVRAAGFEMIIAMTNLHEAVFLGHYSPNTTSGSEKKGWAVVLGLQDLSMVMPHKVQEAATELGQAWKEESGNLGDPKASIARIDSTIDRLRYEILMALEALD